MQLDLELYRRDITTSGDPPVRLSVIDIDPGLTQGTMVFVHGFGGHATQWKAQILFFSDDYRIVAPDLRGHGRSDKPHTQYTIDEMLADLDAVLNATGISSKIVLFGHSFGGAVAAAYAAQRPDRVERLILVGTARTFELSPILRLAFHIPTYLMQPFMTRLMQHVFAPAHALKAFYEHALKVWDGTAYAQIKASTLVIRGHRDIVFQSGAYEAVARQIPYAQEVIIPVSAHLVHLERAEASNRAIQRFLGPTAVTWRQQRDRLRASLVRERPWLKHYEPGVPYTIVAPSQPLHRFVGSAALRYGSRPAILFYGRTLTWRQVYDFANQFANALIGLGVQKGERVMLLLPNTPQMVFCYNGALKAGATVVPYNPLATAQELEHAIVDSGTKVVVALSKFYGMVGAVAAKTGVRHVIVTNLKEYLPLAKRIVFALTREAREGHRVDLRAEPNAHWLQSLLRAQPTTSPELPITTDDLAMIQYTTGTTDEPKGVMLTHGSLVANAIQMRHWYVDAKEGRERVLSALPFTHMYGMTACLNLSAFFGAAMILLPTFATKEVLETIREQRPTIFPGVPDMYVAINNFPNVRRYRLDSVRACLTGSAPLPVEVAEAFVKLTRGRLVEGYGLTEASPATHANPMGGKVKVGSIGIPLPSTDARIVDLEGGQVLPTGDIGELCVRGPQVMRGYWHDDQATAQAIDAEGWLHTGDLARMDEDGYFQIIDRRANIWYPALPTFSKRPIYPRDIEEVLYEHPKVREAVVVPIGNEPRAFVILKDGERARPEELIEYCRTRLEDYLVPRGIEFTRDLPRTYVGKVKRWQLVRDYLKNPPGS